ncbi:c-type cytochrome, partial [Escherichia coli]|uniref:cytochrome-c peroxidase n=2 Tax=Escherichia coli TaxID=562 RepID=UPI002874BB18
MSVGSTHHLEMVFVWKQNYILVDEYFFFCCTWIVNSADNKCATCHGGIILGGRSFEPLGLKKDFNFGEITAADIGRMNVTKEERDKLRQKVPGLRNVALTAPYFHRGDVPTLDGAVKLMLRYQVGKELPQEDVDDIVAFLHSLNGVYTPYMQDKQ